MAKCKAPELTEVYNYPHNSWKGEETKKRSKRNSPRRLDQAYSRTHTEELRYSTSSGRSSDTDHSRKRVEASRHSSSSGRSSNHSRSGARSREFKATADRPRRQVEDTNQEPEVIQLNQEDRQGEENETTNQ